jgi:hypothetical protein
MEALLTAAEVAKHCRVNPMKVIRAIERGNLEADFHASRFHLFRQERLSELQAALAETPSPKAILFRFRR